LEEQRDFDGAIAVARRLLRQDPLHETTYSRLIHLYTMRGDRATALQVYHTCVTTLERELGIGPSAATRALYASLMRSGDASEASSVSQRAPRRAARMTPSTTTRGRTPQLVGRSAEWRQLRGAWRRVIDGSPHVVLLSGEAGIGKTRLAEELEAWVSRQGLVTATARCYATAGTLAYAPVTSWLRCVAFRTSLSTLDPSWLSEVARLVPDVLSERPDLPRPEAMTEGWQRRRFFEALARSLLAVRQPLLLLLDDAQWCDDETLDWLHFLVGFDPSARFLLVATVRTEETLPGHPLGMLTDALARVGGVTEVSLGPLMSAETAALGEQIIGHTLTSALGAALFRETEGNPLFVVEMARAGTWRHSADAAHTSSVDAGGAAGSPFPLSAAFPEQSTMLLPPMVRSVLAARLAQLSPLARDVGGVAAVIGHAFPFSVLAQACDACGHSENAVVRGLDELWQRRILREHGENSDYILGTSEAYDFAHDKLREQVYATLSPAMRHLLHRRVAEALEAVYVDATGTSDAVSAQLADHYERAGLPGRAVAYYLRAAEVAHRLYAHTEALEVLARATSLLESAASTVGYSSLAAISWETAAGVYETYGDVAADTGAYQKANQAYLRALACVPVDAPLQRARIHRKVANAWNLVSIVPFDAVHADARQAFAEAERLLMEGAKPADAGWRQEWIELHFAQIWPPMRWSADEMTATIEKVRPVVVEYGTEEQREFLSYATATRDFIRARYVTSPEGIARFPERRATLAAIGQSGNRSKLGAYHLALGMALLFADQLDEAEDQFEQSLRIGEEIGNARLRSHSLSLLPFIYRRRGQVQRVRNLLARADAKGAAQNNSILTGHQAWLAWRSDRSAEALRLGLAAVAHFERAQRNPFQWTARGPLVGIALAQEQDTAALEHVRTILDPSQQRLPDILAVPLEVALGAWDSGERQEAHTRLVAAVPLATELGYL
jgi:tetratricopeptide (TPR) repeat protein